MATADDIRAIRDAAPPARWPEPLGEAAYHGLAGRFVRTVEPHSEADPAALLVQTLIGIGNVIGRNPGLRVEGDIHAANENAVIVGDTAKARKGVSWGRVTQLLAQVDPEWARDHVVNGLASGEGVVWHVRDPIAKRRKAKNKAERAQADEDGFITIEEDAGVLDKRLLVQEAEFAHVLKVMAREGNTLSATLRALWETGNRNGLTKNDPTRCTGAHVSVVAHITTEELRSALTETERANGLANRFLFVCARRSKSLPFGGNLQPAQLALLAKQFKEAVEFARRTTQVSWGLATQLWEDVYTDLSTGAPGMFGAVTARAEAHVVRLAEIFALLDQTSVIGLPHLQAALEVWRHSEDSAAYVFGGRVGHPLADRLLTMIRDAGETGITRGELRDRISHNIRTEQVEIALGRLLRRGLVIVEREPSGGRPREKWFPAAWEERGVSWDETPSGQTSPTEVSSHQTPLSSHPGENAIREDRWP